MSLMPGRGWAWCAPAKSPALGYSPSPRRRSPRRRRRAGSAGPVAPVRPVQPVQPVQPVDEDVVTAGVRPAIVVVQLPDVVDQAGQVAAAGGLQQRQGGGAAVGRTGPAPGGVEAAAASPPARRSGGSPPARGRCCAPRRRCAGAAGPAGEGHREVAVVAVARRDAQEQRAQVAGEGVRPAVPAAEEVRQRALDARRRLAVPPRFEHQLAQARAASACTPGGGSSPAPARRRSSPSPPVRGS